MTVLSRKIAAKRLFSEDYEMPAPNPTDRTFRLTTLTQSGTAVAAVS